MHGREEYHLSLRQLVDALFRADREGNRDDADLITSEIDRLTDNREPPLERLEHALQPWASFVIIPVFALANAGVELSGEALAESLQSRLSLGIIAGLVIGKPLGILALSWLTVRLRLAALPDDISWADVAAVGLLAGIGFTVSLFIAALAFDSAELVDQAKVGILGASLLAGSLGFVAVRFAQRSR